MVPREDERPKTIVLKCDPNSQHEEGRAKAGEAIYPGMLIMVDYAESDDMPRTPEIVKKHNAQGTAVAPRIVKEDRLRGDKIYTDAYDDDDVIPYHHCQSGDVVMVRVAAGSEINEDTLLTSAGNGLLEPAGAGDVALFIAGEKIYLSGDDATDPPLIRAVCV